jgi:hypothetical protein
MAIINKVALPPIYGAEAKRLEELVFLGSNKTTTGNITFFSSTSNVEYSTLTSYSGIYAGTGETGMLNMLSERVLKDYILTSDWVSSITNTVENYKVSIGTTSPTPNANKIWVDTN